VRAIRPGKAISVVYVPAERDLKVERRAGSCLLKSAFLTAASIASSGPSDSLTAVTAVTGDCKLN
jgi:hypothetical protein